MTNEEIAKIKAEAERLENYYTNVEWYVEALVTFLSTLESEKPVPNDLDFEQELYNRFGQIKDFTLGMRIGQYFYELGCRRTAEKYDEIEYNRQRGEEKPMNQDGLEEELDRFIASGKSVTVEDCGTYKVSYHDFKKVARHFAEWQKEQDDRLVDIIYQQGIEKGKDDMKEQMLKEAEECELYWDGDFLAIDLNMAALGYYERDKVKIIIVKEDEKTTQKQPGFNRKTTQYKE